MKDNVLAQEAKVNIFTVGIWDLKMIVLSVFNNYNVGNI